MNPLETETLAGSSDLCRSFGITLGFFFTPSALYVGVIFAGCPHLGRVAKVLNLSYCDK